MQKKSAFHLLHRTAPWQRLLLLIAWLPSLGLADETRYNLKAVDDYILPGYAQLAERNDRLAQQADRFCHQPDERGLRQLHEAYHLAMDSWQFIQPIRLGPIEQALRSYRLLFWPDKRQSVSRHLATLLDKSDPNALKQDNFAKGSVAVQGFSALERLLFSPSISVEDFAAPDSGEFRCRVILAITRNLADIAHAVVKEWRSGDHSHRALIASAARGNAAYADSSEVSARLFNNLYTQIELMLDQKLRAVLGSSRDRARRKRSESWRSGRSLSNLVHNLDGVEALTESAFLSRLVDPPLSRRLHDQLALCRQRLGTIDLPLIEAVKDREQRPQVEALVTAMGDLKKVIVGELAPALEIPIGFNSLDGD
jgi:predicted lipoprotein